jgi:DNA polymerase elongation subunit (family B)
MADSSGSNGLDLPDAPLVFGWERSPGLIAVALAGRGDTVRLYRRSGGRIAAETIPFTPFLLVSDVDLAGGLPAVVETATLEGSAAFRRLVRFRSWSDALAGRDRCRERSGLAPNAPGAPYRLIGDPAQQFLLLTGRTSFGGLGFGHLHRLALDIEVVTTDGFEFPSAARPGDRIVAVALADNRGFRHVIRGDLMDERAVLQELVRIVTERDPDVIEGHNIFRFDLEYLEARARLHGVTLILGRDGTALRGRPSRLQIAERAIGYRRYEAPGRHIIDTWVLAQLHDVGTRDLPGYGLKQIARHLGLAGEDRTYIDPSAIARELRDDPDRLMAYAADDAVETLRLAEIFAPPYFAQAQVVPFDYQSTVLRGAAAKIDALMLRQALRRGLAVPAPAPGTSVGGGHVAIVHQGVGRPVLHVDVTSLYPSLMLAHRIAPRSDTVGIFLELLERLRDFRVRAKRLARDATDPVHAAHFGALQQSFKILINAFYGYLAFSAGHWNDFEAANRVTAEGRAVVGRIMERLTAMGAIVLEADTDGVYFVPPPTHRPEDDETLLGALALNLPAEILLELDGRYAAMLSYKAKTYALLDERGRVTLKGSGFRSRGLEPLQRQIIEDVVGLLLAGRGADVKAVIQRWLEELAGRRVAVRLLARTETLQETLETYRERLAAGARNPSAAYELALASGRVVQPGDQISYYVAGRGAHVTVNDHARLLSAWDPRRPDENIEYYQAKALEIWERFRPLAECEGLRPYSGEPDSSSDPQLSLF